MPAPFDLKYRAFLSYAHADVTWGKRLHGQLEAFRIDKDLVGRQTPLGPIPKSLRPVFRDREDFSGGHTLTNATIAALDASAALVVLCSTVAASRPAVNEEVRLFRWRHPERPVIPVIIEGTWPNNFPPALRFEIELDGTVTDRPVTILGPDLRESADGLVLGLAKIVAGLVGIGTDEIFRRAERDRRRRLRNLIAVLTFVVFALSGLTVWAELNRQKAERNFNLAKDAADGLVFDIAQGLRDVEGMRAESVARILETARGTFDKLADGAPDNLDLQYSRSVMLNEFGTTYVRQGNLSAALDAYKAAMAVRERLAKSDPGNADWQRSLFVSHIKKGEVLEKQGNLAAALDEYSASLAIAERTLESDPGPVIYASKLGNTGGLRDLSVSHNHIGNVLVALCNKHVTDMVM